MSVCSSNLFGGVRHFFELSCLRSYVMSTSFIFRLHVCFNWFGFYPYLAHLLRCLHLMIIDFYTITSVNSSKVKL